MRRTELDQCRIIGCLMVLVIHVSAGVYNLLPLESAGFAMMNFISTSVRGGVPIFFMLTGALMLSRQSLDLSGMLKKHVFYLAGIFLLWSFIYALLSRIVSGDFGTAYDFVYSVVKGHYHMWFIPAMIVCYLFVPIVHAALHGVKLSHKYLLGLFFVLVLLTSNMNLTPDTAPILHQITLHLRLDYLGYMLYLIWGWWLSTKAMPKKTLWIAPLVFFACCLLSSAGNMWYSHYKSGADGWLFSYFSLPNFIESTAIFCFFLALKDRQFKRTGLIKKLADCTLGVYLIHPMMINLFEVLGLGTKAHIPVGSVTLLTLLLAVSCFALVYVAKRIALVNKLL